MKNEQLALVSVVFSLFLSFAVLLSPTVVATDAVVAQEVKTEMETAEEPVEVLVVLEEPEAEMKRERKKAVARKQSALIEHVKSTEGVRVLNTFWISNAVLVEFEPGYDYEKLTTVGEVRSLKPNTEIEVLGSAVSSKEDTTGAVTAPTSTTTPTATSTPYGINQINAPSVWSQYGTQGGGVNVAVLDTGVNVSHPDIDLRTTNPSDPTYPGGWAEFDTQGNRVTGSTPYDSEGHGTHVSGTIVGEHTGVAPDANLMHGLIIKGQSGTLAQALSGVEWAIENDADVVSMSIGGGTRGVWADVARNANDMGVVLVSSVGNSGAGTSASPGNVYDVISVGAVDQNLNVAGFSGGEVIDTDSAWGNSALDHWPSEYVVPDVVAPGVQVKSTYSEGGYAFSSGTSMAAPHVAGAVALAVSASGDKSPEEVREAFALTAFGSGSAEPDTRKGHGSADAVAVTEHLLDDASVSGTVVDTSGATVSEAEVRINGVRVDDTDGSYQVGLAQGTWSIEASAPGYEDTTETVSLSQGETVERDIVLGETNPAVFEVSSLNGPSSVETDGGMTVSATVTNTGDTTGTQDVTLRVGNEGETLDDTAVVAQNQFSLDGGASENVEFTVGTPNTGGSYTYGVFTEDGSATNPLTVEDVQPAVFGVDNLNGPSSAETGETVTVTATVRNEGEQEGTKDVNLRLAEQGKRLDGDTVVGTRNDLTIGEGGSETVGFSIETPRSEGSYSYGVFTEDGSLTDTMTVEDTEPAFFEVRGVETDEEVVAEQPFTTNATVENTGDVTDTQEIELLLDGEAEESRMQSLAGGDTAVVEFRGISVTDSGSLDVTFASEDDGATSTVDVLAPAFFEVSNLSPTRTTAERGDEVTVTANVTNTGEVGATETVGMYLNGTEVGNETVSLPPGDSENVSFGITAPMKTGEHSYSIRTADTESTGTLISEERLLESPTLDVSDEIWTAVTAQDGDAGNLSLADLGDVISAYRSNPDDAEVDGVGIGLADIGNLIRYYRNEVS